MCTLGRGLDWLREYVQARKCFLVNISSSHSCRDPLTEFSEWAVCKLLQGTPAESRVQRGYDLTAPDGRHVEVRSLSNPAGGWRNEHTVNFINARDDYALVFFEGLHLQTILVFPRETITEVCKKLKKRHGNQETALQLTCANYRKILEDLEGFASVGVRSYTPADFCP